MSRSHIPRRSCMMIITPHPASITLTLFAWWWFILVFPLFRGLRKRFLEVFRGVGRAFPIIPRIPVDPAFLPVSLAIGFTIGYAELGVGGETGAEGGSVD